MSETAHSIPLPLNSDKNWGIQAILLACVLNAIMGAGFYFAHKIEPEFSSLTGLFIRVLCNLVFIAPILSRNKKWRIRSWSGNRSLWLWAIFGVGTTITFYPAIPLAGAGIVTFLNAGSGIFIALFAPLVARQDTSLRQWAGIVACVIGLYLIASPDFGAFFSLGASLAILSGLFSGLAYLMVARAKKALAPEVVMLHWVVANILCLLVVFSFVSLTWPAKLETWLVILATGMVAAAAQYLMTIAYQSIPSALAACISYLGPILSVMIDLMIFGIPYGVKALLGCLIVLFFGLYLPLRKKRDKSYSR